MTSVGYLRIAACGTMLLGLCLAVEATAQTPSFKRMTTVEVPGEPLAGFDLGVVDPKTQTYYLADRSNKAVDIIDARTNRFVGRIGGFIGPSTKNNVAGPNGLVLVPELNQLWAGDGDSTVKVIDLKANPPKIVATIATGGTKRSDEVAYDPKDGIVLFVNDADEPPFVSLISTKPDHRILGQIKLPDATEGVEQPVWDAASGRFYVSVPQIKEKKEDGAVIVIDPKAMKVTGMLPVDKCVPAGLTLGPQHRLLVGCSQDAVEAGFPAKTILLDSKTGTIVKTFTEIGGSDQVGYNAKDGHYYLAARGMPGGPVLGVIDAKANKWLANLPTAKNAHSVAANPGNNHVFVPLAPNPDCAKGCIAVYGVTKG
jgi:DNA-binding beta-propeller fold protein YncE